MAGMGAERQFAELEAAWQERDRYRAVPEKLVAALRGTIVFNRRPRSPRPVYRAMPELPVLRRSRSPRKIPGAE